MTDYRERLYERYAAHATRGATVISPADLASRRPYFVKLIGHHFPSDRSARVLDLGCGYGALVYFARELGYLNVEGVDRAPELVRAAHGLGLETVREGDLFPTITAAASNSLDLVVCFDVLEHLRKEEQLALVDLIFSRLKPGGRLILHVPNGDAPFVGRVYFGDFTHETAFTRTSMAQLLGAGGFVDVHCFEDVPVVHGVKSAVRNVLWRGIRTALRFYVAVETGSAPADSIFSQNLLAVADRPRSS